MSRPRRPKQTEPAKMTTQERLGIASFVTVVSDESNLLLPPWCKSKRYSPDIPGGGRRASPRWGAELQPAAVPYHVVIERLRVEWGGEQAIREGRYAVAFAAPTCPRGCGARGCAHRRSDGVLSEIVVVDPRAESTTRPVVLDWETFCRRRRVFNQMRYQQAHAAAESSEPGKGVTKLLHEADGVMQQLRELLSAQRIRNHELREEAHRLIEQARAKTGAARAKYQGLVHRD